MVSCEEELCSAPVAVSPETLASGVVAMSDVAAEDDEVSKPTTVVGSDEDSDDDDSDDDEIESTSEAVEELSLEEDDSDKELELLEIACPPSLRSDVAGADCSVAASDDDDAAEIDEDDSEELDALCEYEPPIFFNWSPVTQTVAPVESVRQSSSAVNRLQPFSRTVRILSIFAEIS